MGETRTLQNGMTLYVDPMPGLESAAVGVWARAGAMDETAEENGVAHLLEHMAFKGTNRRTARQIVEDIENVGGQINAGTSYQRTGYYARILKDDVELAIDILADILNEPLLAEEELEREKDVVLQEIGEAWDAPDDAVFDLLQGECFQGYALGRSILGTSKSVTSHDRSRLAAFMSRRYTPNNMVLAAAGAVEPAEIERWANERFLTGIEQPKPTRLIPSYVGGLAGDGRDIEQAHLAFAFPGVGARHQDVYAVRILAELLGGGMSSRLFQSVREEKGLAYSVYAFADCYDDVGLTGVYAGTDPERAVEATRLIRKELEKSAERLDQMEIDRARAMLKSNLLMGLESPYGRIDAAAAQLFAFGQVRRPEDIAARLDSVTTEDVRRCAAAMLSAGPPSTAVVGPADSAAIHAAIAGATA